MKIFYNAFIDQLKTDLPLAGFLNHELFLKKQFMIFNDTNLNLIKLVTTAFWIRLNTIAFNSVADTTTFAFLTF